MTVSDSHGDRDKDEEELAEELTEPTEPGDDAERPPDAEVPEPDWREQAREVLPGQWRGPVPRTFEVPEADAIEQAVEVPDDVDVDREG